MYQRRIFISFFALFLVFVLISCKKKELITRDYESYFMLSNSDSSFTVNKIDSLEIIKVDIEQFNTSFVGSTSLHNGYLYYVDKLYCFVFEIDINGKLNNRFLGQGMSPHEIDIKGIDAFCFLAVGRKIFLCSSLDIHLYDNNWQRISKKYIDWRGKFSYRNIYQEKNPESSEYSIYSFEWEKLTLKSSSFYPNLFFAQIYSEHPEFNAFVSEKYYTEGRILVAIDFENAKIKFIEGRRPPIYLINKYLGHHSFFDFHVAENGDFIVAHEIDPSIYVYDKDFQLKKTLSAKPFEINESYTSIQEFDLDYIRDLYFTDRPKKGFFDEIYVDEELDIIIRSFRRGTEFDHDGIQIFKSGKLLGEFNVPKGFQVAGRYNDVFVSNVITNEENEEMYFYQFKL